MKASLPFVLASIVFLAGQVSAADPPLITYLWTADPSAHVFEDRIYLYASQDIDAGVPPNSEGDHFVMRDYHVFSMNSTTGPVTDHGLALTLEDIPWAKRRLWAPDAAYKDSTYYFYFPTRGHDDIFRIGVATSNSPSGPFAADPAFIPGTYSIDPASYTDSDGTTYLMWGDLHGGQLQCWQDKTTFDPSWSGQKEPTEEGAAALSPVTAALSDDLHTLGEAVRDLVILAPETGRPVFAADKDRRFFEGAWMHRRGDRYYLTYSTGTTHYLVYAIGDNPYGPFTHKGRLLEPVRGWTTHGSIVEYQNRWFLFYHDSEASRGVDWLRQVKVKEIWYDVQGRIVFQPV